MTASGDVCLLVVRLSDSFGDFWPALASDIGVALTDWTPAAAEPPTSDAAGVLIAAGGREPEGADHDKAFTGHGGATRIDVKTGAPP